jgi:NAD(P)-dependent dehydrogenase (short-subunit alcohol dehydrogenase family)
MSLVGQVAVIAGAASGIGLAIAEEFACAGAKVAIAGLENDRAEEVAGEIAARGGTAIGLPVDVADRFAIETLFDRVGSELGPIDILVNNAGISIARSFRRITDEEWQRAASINQTGAFLCSQVAATNMIKRGRRGRIINIACSAWLGPLACSSAKGGVVSATRSLAIQFAKYGITVNCLAPGLIDTPSLRNEPPEVLERLLQAQPMGSLGLPADVAWAARFFAGPGAQAITGQVLYVCGGRSLYAQPAH